MSKLFSIYNPPARPVHALESRLSELRALDRLYLNEEIELAKKGAVIESPAASDKREIRALELIAEFSPAEPLHKNKSRSKSKDPNLRLAWLMAERVAIERAIEIAGQRLSDARLDHVREFLATSSADWNENVRQTALTLCSLWALNRQRETLKIKSGNPSRPCSMHHRLLLGLAAPGETQSANAKLFVQEALDNGIITAREVQKILGA